MNSAVNNNELGTAARDRVAGLVDSMTLDEKIGQMTQVDAGGASAVQDLAATLREGRIGAVLNQVDVDCVNELQRIAVEESRLGIPLLVGRDVIHGFRTILPIPLGQAATWNVELVRAGAHIAAVEAAAAGINWTFAPMIDVARDPRWGRVAESFGEDPYLCGRLGAAMIEGFQRSDLAAAGSIAACAKHFAGYGAVESGRDYATTNIPEIELRNVHLPPFRAAIDAGVVTLMASFSDLNGVPASANAFLMRQVLRDEWGFRGFVVSDWDSIRQIAVHGITDSDEDSARVAATAGIDMEMAGDAYRCHLARLVADGRVSVATIDRAVAGILTLKFQLGLFDDAQVDPQRIPHVARETKRRIARQAALESVVLLKNDRSTLPLSRERVASVAVLGPLADAPYEQLGTWIFDGDPGESVTGLAAIRELAGDAVAVRYLKTLETSRSRSTEHFAAALEAARCSDAVILFLGEESILSGEAHCRADIRLPGAQAELAAHVRKAGKPVIGVIMAGRPLVLTDVVDELDALLFAWHPGTMGGAAIADLLFGNASPSGRLPATFPRMVGQIPIYLGQKNTGRPPAPETIIHIDDIEVGAPQTSLGMTSFHLDAGYRPLFPFGYGLSFSEFRYEDLRLGATEIRIGESIRISVSVTNAGAVPADEVVQLYVRDPVASVTRPVRELKGFQRVHLDAGSGTVVDFDLHTDQLAFHGRDNAATVEPGEIRVWVGGSSEADLGASFRVMGPSE